MIQTTRRMFAAGLAGVLVPGAARGQSWASPGSAAPIAPGMRFVWMAGAASIPGETWQIAPDENGEWVDKTTGRRYGQLQTPGPAGVGFVVADVLAVEPSGHLLQVTSLLLRPDLGNATSLIDTIGLHPSPRDVPDYWFPRDELATMADRKDGSSRIARMPYSLGGKTYGALRAQIQSGGGWSQRTFDLDTGITLVTSSTTQGSPTQVLAPGNQVVPGAGNTQLTFSQFAGARRTGLPGPGAVYPDAVRRLRAITYTGRRTTALDGMTDVSVPPTPLEVRFDIGEAAASSLGTRMSVAGAAPVERLVPAGTVGSLWMDPAVLARMEPGSALDRDPIVGLNVFVSGRQGSIVAVGVETAMTRLLYAYDSRTGLLSRFQRHERLPPATVVTDLQISRVD